MTTPPMNPSSTIKAALIDLDGTLIHTLPDLAEAANRLLHDLGQAPMNTSTLANFVGKGSRDMVRRMLLAREQAHDYPPTDTVLDTLVAQFFEHYRQVNTQHSALYPGVIEGLQAFRAAGIRMAVVTNKALEFSQQLLNHTGLSAYFDTIVAGDTSPHKKPHPAPLLHACQHLEVSPSEALMVGDSINDAQAARAAGSPVVLLPYGYNHGQDIHSFDVDGIVSSIGDAARWAASWRNNHTDQP